MNLHTDQATLDHARETGLLVLFGAERCTHWVHPAILECSPDCDYLNSDPPAWMVEASQPCETPRHICNRIGPNFGRPDHRGCPDCSGGRQRHTITVHGGWFPCPELAVHEWGPWQAFHNDNTPAPLRPCVELWDDDTGFVWTPDTIETGCTLIKFTLPPGVDPDSLVGQWAVGFRLETP